MQSLPASTKHIISGFEHDMSRGSVFLLTRAYHTSQVAPPRKQNKALRGNVEMAAAISKVHQINTWMELVSREESSKLTAERDKR